MNKIKCVECGKEMESEHRDNVVSCKCHNKSFTCGSDVYQRIGGVDLTKVLIWDTKKQEYGNVVL